MSGLAEPGGEPFVSYTGRCGGQLVRGPRGAARGEQPHALHRRLDSSRDPRAARAASREAPVVDCGCSTGYLLEDLRRAIPDATLIGVDLVAAGLRKAHAIVPERPAAAGRRLRPAARGRERGRGGEREPARARARRPAARSPRSFGSCARGARGDRRPGGPGQPTTTTIASSATSVATRGGSSARKARCGGARGPARTSISARSLYPAFWAVKQRNRRRYEAPRRARRSRQGRGKTSARHRADSLRVGSGCLRTAGGCRSGSVA